MPKKQYADNYLELKTTFLEQFKKFKSIEDITNKVFIPGNAKNYPSENTWEMLLLKGNLTSVGDAITYDSGKVGILSSIKFKYSYAKDGYDYELMLKTDSGEVKINALRAPQKANAIDFNPYDVYIIDNPLEHGMNELLSVLPLNTPKQDWEISLQEWVGLGKPTEEHKQGIGFAIAHGEIIPKDVITDYPDLQEKNETRYLEKPIARKKIKEAVESGRMDKDIKSGNTSLVKAMWLCEQIKASLPITEYVKEFKIDKNEYGYIAKFQNKEEFAKQYMGVNIENNDDIRKRLEKYLFIPQHTIDSILKSPIESLKNIINENQLPDSHNIHTLLKEFEFYNTCKTLNEKFGKDSDGLSMMDLSEASYTAALNSYYEHAVLLQKEKTQDIRHNASDELLQYATWALQQAHTPIDAKDAKGGRPDIWMLGQEVIHIPREFAAKLLEWQQTGTHISVTLSLPQNTEKNVMADTIGLSNEYNPATEVAVKKNLLDNAIKELQKQYFKKIIDRGLEKGSIQQAIKDGRANESHIKVVANIYPSLEKELIECLPLQKASIVHNKEANVEYPNIKAHKEYWEESMEFWQKTAALQRKENSESFSKITNEITLVVTQGAGKGNEYRLHNGHTERVMNNTPVPASKSDITFINESVAMGHCTITDNKTKEPITLPYSILPNDALKELFIEKVMEGLNQGFFEKSIQGKKMSAEKAKNIIESANIMLPKNISDLYEREFAVLKKEQNKIKIRPEMIKYEDSKSVSAIYSPSQLYNTDETKNFTTLKDIFSKDPDMFAIANAFDAFESVPASHDRKEEIKNKNEIEMYAITSSLNQKGILPGEALYLSREAAEFYKNNEHAQIIKITISPKDVLYDQESPQQFICAPKKPMQYFAINEVDYDRD